MTGKADSSEKFLLPKLWPRYLSNSCSLILAVIIFFCLLSPYDASSQVEESGFTDSSPEGAVTQGKNSAIIGESGYIVPIPEIKLKNIIGDQPGKPIPSADEWEKKALDTEKRKPLKEQDTLPESPVQRLPFDPVEKLPIMPEDEPDTIPEHSTEAAERDETKTPEPSPTEPATPTDEKADEGSHSPWLNPPLAPEETFSGPPPVPKKEMLTGRFHFRLPQVMEIEPAKNPLVSLKLERDELQDILKAKEAISLDLRREPEIIPAVEAGSKSEDVDRTEMAPAKEEIDERPVQAAPMKVPEPEDLGASPERGPEAPIEEKPSSRDDPPPFEKPSSPAKEHLPSPLLDDDLTSKEVRDYLRETAPILEELSLLMTRSPALSIEDYDPSDPNELPVPMEIQMKMDLMKRGLQVLDSKTFAVIPPAKYVEFHSLIRQSVTQAHQACDAIMNYFQENRSDSFQKAVDHLNEAGKLIRRTRAYAEDG